MPVIDNKAVGKRIKDIRTNTFEKKITLEDFGKLLSPPAIRPLVSKWEKGLNLPNDDRIKQIAKIGNVTTDYLLFGKQITGFGERIKNIRKNNLKLSKLEFSRIFLQQEQHKNEKILNEEVVQAWEDENLLPTRKQLEKIASMGNTTIDEILWNEKPDPALTLLKEYNDRLDLTSISEEENHMAQILFERFLTIRHLVVKDLDSSKVLRDIFDSLLDGIAYDQSSDDNSREQLINTLISEYQKLLDKTI